MGKTLMNLVNDHKFTKVKSANFYSELNLISHETSHVNIHVEKVNVNIVVLKILAEN